MGRFEGWDLASPSNVHRAMARRRLLQPVRYQAQRRPLDPYSGTLNHPAPHKIAKAHKVRIILDTDFILLPLALLKKKVVMIRKRVVHLLVAIVALTLVNGEATAFATTEAPDTDQIWLDDGAPEPPNPSLADASELATLSDLSSVDPRNVYSVEDLEQYGTFRADPSALLALNSSGWITAGNCTYKQRVDDPHWSDG